MISDIEQEYNDHLRNVWQNLPDASKGILKPLREPERMYDIVSLQIIQFLKCKLKNLSANKNYRLSDKNVAEK